MERKIIPILAESGAITYQVVFIGPQLPEAPVLPAITKEVRVVLEPDQVITPTKHLISDEDAIAARRDGDYINPGK